MIRRCGVAMPVLFTEPNIEDCVPDTAIRIATALHQMDLILASVHFRNSKRYPVLFRYIVVAAVEGRADALKERTLGVAVFQRPPDYDTNSDPIVRITAGEVRKRIAQYYHEPGHEHELLIDLPSGSYIPRFKTRPAATAELLSVVSHVAEPSLLNEEPPAASLPEKKSVSESQPAASLISHRFLYSGMAFITLVATCVVALALRHRQSVLDSVWQPFLKSGAPVLVLVPELLPHPTNAPAANQPSDDQLLTVASHIGRSDHVVFSDVQALVRMTGLMERHQHPYRVQAAQATTFADLRQGPTVLLGGFDNPWTLRTLKSARYVFIRDAAGKEHIGDKKNPSNLQWSVDFSQPYNQLNYDYAIVARFFDPDTQQPVIVVAGIGENGTKAASEFLTDSNEAQSLMAPGSPWKDRNFEVILGTQVIDGVSGPPRILANEVW